MSDLREPHERPDTCSAAELADILDRFIALPSTEAIFKAAAKKLRALSAEPAQEMTDEQIDAIKKSLTWWNGSHDMTNHRTFARAVIAADRASRLPEMGEGDWPPMPDRGGGFTGSFANAKEYRAGQVAAVEAYKALVRGKT